MAVKRGHLKSQTHASHYRNVPKLVKGKKHMKVAARGVKVGKRTFGKGKHKNSKSMMHP